MTFICISPLSCTAAAKLGCDVGGITPGLGNAAASMWFTVPDDGEELLGVALFSEERANLLFEAAAAAEAAVLYPLATPPA